MNERIIHKFLTYSIAAVWLVNGLYCKILNFVPRHEEIVGRILHLDSITANIFTIFIGFSEMIMAIWVSSGFKKRFNALTQIIIVVVMNILEFTLVPDLLLWGRCNILFAFLFTLVVYYNEFYLNKKSKLTNLKCFHS